MTKNGGVGTDIDIALEGNDTTNVEDDNLLAAAVDSIAERARTRVVEISDVSHLATTSASNVTAVPLSTGEGRNLCHRSNNDG